MKTRRPLSDPRHRLTATRRIVLAMDDDEMVGVCSYHTFDVFTDPIAVMDETYVAPNTSRTDLGRRLVAMVIDLARGDGCKVMNFPICVRNDRAELTDEHGRAALRRRPGRHDLQEGAVMGGKGPGGGQWQGQNGADPDPGRAAARRGQPEIGVQHDRAVA